MINSDNEMKKIEGTSKLSTNDKEFLLEHLNDVDNRIKRAAFEKMRKSWNPNAFHGKYTMNLLVNIFFVGAWALIGTINLGISMYIGFSPHIVSNPITLIATYPLLLSSIVVIVWTTCCSGTLLIYLNKYLRGPEALDPIASNIKTDPRNVMCFDNLHTYISFRDGLWISLLTQALYWCIVALTYAMYFFFNYEPVYRVLLGIFGLGVLPVLAILGFARSIYITRHDRINAIVLNYRPLIMFIENYIDALVKEDPTIITKLQNANTDTDETCTKNNQASQSKQGKRHLNLAEEQNVALLEAAQHDIPHLNAELTQVAITLLRIGHFQKDSSLAKNLILIKRLSEKSLIKNTNLLLKLLPQLRNLVDLIKESHNFDLLSDFGRYSQIKKSFGNSVKTLNLNLSDFVQTYFDEEANKFQTDIDAFSQSLVDKND